MNNIFNIKRLGLAFRKDILEGRKRYALMFLTMLGIIAVMLTWNYWEHYDDVERYGNQNTIIYTNKDILSYLSLMFGGFGIIFASTFASPMNSKLKKLSYLVSPSSNFEKYLTRWIIVTVAYIISFFIAMWVADAIRVAICSARFPNLDIAFVDLTKLVHPGKYEYRSDYFFPKEAFIIYVSAYLLLQSFFVLGSTFWEKSSFIKTFTAMALIVLSYILICRWTILLFYGELDTFGNVLSSFKPDEIDFEEEKNFIIAASVISVFTFANWALAYFRLRESEITKRI